MNRRFYFFALAFFCFSIFLNAQNPLEKICSDYIAGYKKLEIPPTELSYAGNFENIKENESLKQQGKFFENFGKKINSIQSDKFNPDEKIRFGQLKYEIAINTERVALEKKWNSEGRKIPKHGLHSLPDYKEWYSFYIKHFTSVNITPEEVFEMGQNEVKKVQQQIKELQNKLGFVNETDFYSYLQSDTFFLTDKQQILNAYAKIDKTLRANLNNLYPSDNIPEIGVMEWPDATASNPPGMYQNKENNSYGKDVFLYNFSGQKHNRRCMEWFYMHEGIPGHHLQSVIRKSREKTAPLQNEFFYFGNAEGWACYIEDFGKEIGMYKDDYVYLGKWEWDLVRSARLVMEVGIHYYGWSKEKAMEYWKENIKGQDEIAEREITRITKWAGQALCYKVGALTIKKIAAQKMKKGMSLKQVNTFLLGYSDVPLQVLMENG
jgi:uncharacterized protein (DUF885 family)